MSRAFCIPGIVFIFCAFVLNFLVSISLPYLPALDIVRVHFNNGNVKASGQESMSELRLGIWAPCYYSNDGARTCIENGYGYSIEIQVEGEDNSGLSLGGAWTRGLAVHPVAAAVAFIAFVLSFSTHITVTLLSSGIAFLSAVLTLIAFACDIALLAKLRKDVGNLPGGDNFTTNPAPAFWMTLVAFIVLLLGGCTVCFGRRRARMSGASTYTPPAPRPSFISRFRKT